MDNEPKSNKTVIYGIIGVIVLLVLYGIYRRIASNTETSNQIAKTFNIVFWIVIIVGVLYGAYKIYDWYTTKKGVLQKTYTPDEMFKLWQERMIFKEGANGYYDEDGELHLSKDSIEVLDRRPFVSAGTGEEFIIMEVLVKQLNLNIRPGLRILKLPLNRDKKLVAGGLYTEHFHTNYLAWLKSKSMLKKLPISTPQKENLRLLTLAQEQDIDLNELPQYNQQQQQPYQQNYNKYSRYINPEYAGDENVNEEN